MSVARKRGFGRRPNAARVLLERGGGCGMWWWLDTHPAVGRWALEGDCAGTVVVSRRGADLFARGRLGCAGDVGLSGSWDRAEQTANLGGGGIVLRLQPARRVATGTVDLEGVSVRVQAHRRADAAMDPWEAR